MKQFYTIVVSALVAALLSGGGSYMAFAQRVKGIEENKASKEQVQQLTIEVSKLVVQLENDSEKSKEFKETVKEITIKREGEEEKLRESVQNVEKQLSEVVGQLKIVVEQLLLKRDNP